MFFGKQYRFLFNSGLNIADVLTGFCISHKFTQINSHNRGDAEMCTWIIEKAEMEGSAKGPD
ncbi:MAG: hypothetical protein J4N63_04905, partial [Chloroflexi bacterium]|nr:hypothetical protein [Chloroflexota bacterium]